MEKARYLDNHMAIWPIACNCLLCVSLQQLLLCCIYAINHIAAETLVVIYAQREAVIHYLFPDLQCPVHHLSLCMCRYRSEISLHKKHSLQTHF